MPKVASIEHPLDLRGIHLRSNDRTFVVAAIDFCGIYNTSDETIRDALAAWTAQSDCWIRIAESAPL